MLYSLQMIKENYTTCQVFTALWHVPARYTDLKFIGQGTYSCVCSALDTSLNRQVAIKKLAFPFRDSNLSKHTYREVKIMKHMDHENIVCLIDLFTPQCSLDEFRDVYLVTPLMYRDLHTIINNKIFLLEDDSVVFVMYQILRALKYLHSVNIIHRDLKPMNIGVDNDWGVKVFDFGLSRVEDEVVTDYVVTRWYRAPEVVLQAGHYTKAVDLWSAGCILAEMLLREQLFRGSNYRDQVVRIFSLFGRPDEGYMERLSENTRIFINGLNIPEGPTIAQLFNGKFPTAVDLMLHLLVMDPERRITTTDALRHPFFTGYSDEEDEPEATPFFDPLEGQNTKEFTVEQWKNYVWQNILDFTPNLRSLDGE